MIITVTTRTTKCEVDLGDADDFAIITVDGRDLVGIFADSGAGWYPHGDGGEHFGDWTPLAVKDLPAACGRCGKSATREILPELDDDSGSALYCDTCQPATIGDVRPLKPTSD